jgi:hypothetical protein
MREERERSERSDESAGRSPVAGAVGGGVGGAMVGATVGTVTAGPIGTIVGAIAGAIGGSWVGIAAATEAHYDESHDRRYRAHYESSSEQLADRTFEQLRPAYQVGHLAAVNADYFGRDFEEIEPDLQRGWTDELHREHGDWEAARRFARHAFDQARGNRSTGANMYMTSEPIGETQSHQRPSFADPIAQGDPDHVAGERGVPGRGDIDR